MAGGRREVDLLRGTRVLTVGAAVATRIAGYWLGASGADVSTLRRPAAGAVAQSIEADFEQLVGQRNRAVQFDEGEPYRILLGDSAALSLAHIPANLIASAVTVEITSPLPATEDFDESLIADMQLWARSGLGYLTREMHTEGSINPPCLPVSRQASVLAGIAAATAAVSACFEDAKGGHVAVDQLELLALMPMQPVAFAQLTGRIVGRDPAPAMPGGNLATLNGLVYVRPVEPAHWAALLHLIGDLDSIADEVVERPMVLRESVAQINARLEAWARRRSSEEAADLCQAQHIPVAPVYRADQVVGDAHLNERAFFGARGETGSAKRIRLPWLTVEGAAMANTGERRKVGARLRDDATRTQLPLAGVRILDLSWAWAGPFAATLLSDLGAEIINVEWHPRVSNLRRNAPFAEGRDDSNNTAAWWSANQRGKLSIGIDLKSAEGRAIVRDLAAGSDAVVENFSPGVVDRLGVGHADLLDVNSRLVYVSLSAFGQTGPHSHYIGYGMQVYASAGASFASSQSGAQTQMWIPVADPVSGLVGAYAMAAHILHARATGRPTKVDVSELEALASISLEPLIEALAGRTAVHTTYYRVVASADGKFVAIFATDLTDWEAIGVTLGCVFESEHEPATSTLDAAHLVSKCDEAGIPSALIADSADVLADSYLQAREFWMPDPSPEIAPSGVRMGAPIWHLDGERADVWRGAPRLFGDTEAVLRDVLGYPADRIRLLYEQGAVV